MFYSQTFLARKGPLGTVWCAAHLQHKLRKSHYTSTDIPSTVDRIMNPEVPIALRMSSHLLLGVVRIYSKKVDYLYQDCNLVLVTLKNAFVYTDVNLPPNATQAQFNAVTLPETYQLDALDFDDAWSSDAYQDSHVLRQEDITLADEIDNPTQGQYVTITFDDDIMQEIPHSEPPHDSIVPMEEDNEVPTNGGEGEQEPINSNTSPNLQVADDDASVPNMDIMNEADNTTNVDIASHDIEEIEVLRDAVTEPNPVLLPELLDGQNKSTASPVERSEQIIRGRETPTLSEENVHVQEQSPLLHSLPSAAFMATPDPFELNLSPGHNSPALELQPSTQPQPQPQPQPERPRARRKRRGQLFDQHPVFSNEYMKGRLDNCADIVKKRRKLPCSSMDAWRFNNWKMKEQLFLEPLVTGMCSDLKNMSGGFTVSNPNLVLSEETNQVPSTRQLEEPQQDTRTEQPSNPVDVEQPSNPAELDESPEHARAEEVLDPAEHLRDETFHHETSILADLMPSSPRIASPPSHHNISTQLSPGTAFQSMQDLGTSLRTGDSKQTTPVRTLEVGDYSGDAGRSYSPAFMASAEDELAFLEMDSQSPADSQGAQGSGGTLSARTRAVAQYLRGQTPLSSSPSEQHEDRTLSLKTILHGRSRKMCARMVYETLVLSSYGLITVVQEEPRDPDEVYGDIKLKLKNSKVSQGQF